MMHDLDLRIIAALQVSEGTLPKAEQADAVGSTP